MARALGGSSIVPVLFDRRYRVTRVAGAVATIDDALGRAGLPQLASAGASRPSFTEATQAITFDGTQQYLATAASALFDLSGACSLVFGGTFPQTAGFAVAASIADAASPSRFMDIRSSDQGAAATIQGQASAVIDSTVTIGSGHRLVILSKNASTGLSIDVPSHARVTGAITAIGAGNNILTLGTFFAAVANWSPTSFDFCFPMTRQATVGDIATILAWAQQNHSTQAAA